MPRGKSVEDQTTLQMALIGYQIEKQKIEERIRDIQSKLRGRNSVGTALVAPAKKGAVVKRVLSPAARRRIAAAQKKRWAEHRRRVAAQGKAE